MTRTELPNGIAEEEIAAGSMEVEGDAVLPQADMAV